MKKTKIERIKDVKVIDYLWIPLAGVTIAGLMILSSIF